MLSLHTNAAALSAQNSISRTQSSLSTSMTRLSTGFRINSAMDDAAGLQIATRLKTQTSGMGVAMRNTQNSISLMQTAEGALDETSSILNRMKDLATQAADGSSTAADQTAMQKEFDSLTDELSNIFGNTKFGGTSLIATGGKMTAALTFQIGASSGEKLSVNFNTELSTAVTDITAATGGAGTFSQAGTAMVAPGTQLTASANAAIDQRSDKPARVFGK